MNARILLNFRVATLCRLLAIGSLVAGLSLTGCGTTATTADTGNGSTEGDTSDDGQVSTDDIRDDATDADGTDHSDTTDKPDATDHDTTDVGDTSDQDVDATGSDIAADADADTSKPDVPVLPICKEAKGSCALCQLCPAFPVCTLKEIGKPDLATYPNDCAAICKLNAVNWPNEVGADLWPTECPACPLCTPTDLKKTNDAYCVTLNSGTKLTVDHQCEVGCVADAKMQADGKTPVATKGACKSSCTNPASSGGAGCPVKGQPICAKEDNGTYTNSCKMQNCDVAGCFPEGATAKTAGCTPDAMTKECDGACYDPIKDKNCTAECSPVCGIKKIKLSNGLTQVLGMSYRSQCVAAADGATVGACDGISATPADACAAGVLYQAKGCCEDVEYGIIHPICASKTEPGKPDTYVTFQNQGEYDCLTKGNSAWTFQYASACICSCNNNEQPVCGANGFTYQNACQAQCYNGKDFTFGAGPCP